MTHNLRKTVAALAVAAACVTPGIASAFESETIVFDMNGTGAGGALNVSAFSWSAGTILAQGLMTTTCSAGVGCETTPNDFVLYGQSQLASFKTTDKGNVAYSTPSELTYQFAVPMVTTSFASGGLLTGGFDLLGTVAPGGPGNFFKIWHSTTGSVAPTGVNTPPFSGNADTMSGTGYGHNTPGATDSCDPLAAGNIIAGETLVFCGRIVHDTFNDPMNPVDSTIDVGQTGTALARLDATNTDNYPTIGSIAATGSLQLFVQAVYQNEDYWISNLETFGIALQTGPTTKLNFSDQTPSALVVGESWDVGNDNTAVGGNGARDINNGICEDTAGDAGPTTCDILFQATGSMSFQRAPEPGSVALLGLSMGLLGFYMRRRRNAA
jgi:hypothetical protein